MDESVLLFTLFYIIFTFCFVFRTNDFNSAGLTVEWIFSKFLGKEADNFIFYHIRRSSWTLFIHSSLLLGYQLCLSWISNYALTDTSFSFFNMITTLSLILPITTAVIVYRWRKDNWENHPIPRKMSIFCENTTSWRTLTSDINLEFRRAGKLTIKCSTLVDVIVTDNWIIKVSPYGMEFAHQSDARIKVDTADTHQLGISGTGATQFLNIQVSYNRRGNHCFYLRLNALDFKDLEDKLCRPVTIAQNIVFHRSRADQFIDVFKEQVYQNPPYHSTEEVEMCIGCMVSPSNVKLVKHCPDDSEPSTCRNCYCRPMWCVSCMGRWFASRQEEDRTDEWLSSKCTCPVCRSVFCILDVSLIVENLVT